MPGSRFNPRLRVYDHQGAWKPSLSAWGTVADGREKRGWSFQSPAFLDYLYGSGGSQWERAHTAEGKVQLELRKYL